MNKFNKELINQYADNLLIGLTKTETNMILKEFNVINANMDLITKIPNINKVLPMTHALDDFQCYLREDEIGKSISVKEALQNCNSTEDNKIKVPKVVG